MDTVKTLKLMAPLLTIALFGAACSSSPQPIIDTKGVDMTQYEQDLAECEVYADEVRTGEGVAKGTAGGAVVGGAVGAVGGGSGTRGAGVGAVLGAAGSGRKAAEEKSRVVKTCLRGRGYKVLN